MCNLTMASRNTVAAGTLVHILESRKLTSLIVCCRLVSCTAKNNELIIHVKKLRASEDALREKQTGRYFNSLCLDYCCSSHLSFSFAFFVHGESTVCASVDVRQHPAVRHLTRTCLQRTQTSQSGVKGEYCTLPEEKKMPSI